MIYETALDAVVDAEYCLYDLSLALTGLEGWREGKIEVGEGGTFAPFIAYLREHSGNERRNWLHAVLDDTKCVRVSIAIQLDKLRYGNGEQTEARQLAQRLGRPVLEDAVRRAVAVLEQPETRDRLIAWFEKLHKELEELEQVLRQAVESD